jgi:glycosyltransferase involved in cell wall biosynthesis
MKILLIAHGALPVPPTGWGAIEACMWSQKQYLEELGHTVDIANTRAIHQVISEANRRQYDFVHTQNELFVLECVAHLQRPFAITSQHPALHVFDPDGPEPSAGMRYLFEDTLRAPVNLVVSETIRDLYLRCGYEGFLRILLNGVETEQFRWAPAGNGRAVCVGQISPRKRQQWLERAARGRVPVDFVGPGDPRCATFVDNQSTRYLGEWSRTELHERLTEYSCLALLSESEASPKVVVEALAAGLSLVVSEACTATLTPAPFITVIPERDRRPEVVVDAIQAAIDANHGYRAEIRQYAIERFDYRTAIIPEYVGLIEQIREYFRAMTGRN